VEYVWISSRILRTRLELRPDVILEYQVSRVQLSYGSNQKCVAVNTVSNVRAVLGRAKNRTIDH